MSFIPDYSCLPTGGSPCTSRIWDPVADGLFSFWPRLSESYNVRPEMAESAYIPGRRSIRTLTTRLVGPFLYNPGISVATKQSAPVASATAEFCSRLFNESLGAIVAIPISKGTQNIGDQLLSCTIDARWVNATVEVSFLRGPFITSGSIQRELLEGLFRKGADITKYQAVRLDKAWAQGTDTFIPRDNKTVFEKLCETVEIWDGEVDAQEPLHAIEAILAVIIAQGMGLTGYRSTIQGSLSGLGHSKEWKSQFLPLHGVFGGGDDAFDVDLAVKQKFPKLQFSVTANGYGYGYSTSTLLSVVTLLGYVAVALSHLIHSLIFSRSTSSSWDSISGILALALRSEKAEALKNTGAGIASLSIYKHPVRLVARKRSLELQVGLNGPLAKEQKIEENQAYG